MPELLGVDVTAAPSGEEQGRVDPRRHIVECVEHNPAQWHGPDRPVRLAALLEDTAGEAPANVEEVLLPIDVAALEGE